MSVRTPSDQARPKRSRRLVGASVALGLLVASIGAPSMAAASCLQGIGDGTYAKSVRTLQSDMMVAALSCNARDRYNVFATTFRSDLQKQGRELRAYFKVQHRGDHFAKLNAYVTELANDASIRHARTGKGFCQSALAVFDELLSNQGQTVDLAGYALRYAIPIRPALAQEIATASNGNAACDELVALNQSVTQ